MLYSGHRFFTRGKAVRTWRWQLTLIQRRS
jgi:hypothetical protein